MSNAARKLHAIPSPAPGDYLGPGVVVSAAAHAIEVEVGDGYRTEARMALAFPYVPEVGDVLLVIGKAAAFYVIGVLSGKGKAVLAFQGAVDVRAEGGPLTLSSDQGVAVRAPQVDIEANKLQMFAGSVVQKFNSLLQRVRGALQVRAGEAHTVVDDRSLFTAKNASIVTEETMSINGKEIHLG